MMSGSDCAQLLQAKSYLNGVVPETPTKIGALPSRLRGKKIDNGSAQHLCQKQNLRIRHKANLGFDPRDDVTAHVPPHSLASRSEFWLRPSSCITQAANFWSNNIAGGSNVTRHLAVQRTLLNDSDACGRTHVLTL